MARAISKEYGIANQRKLDGDCRLSFRKRMETSKQGQTIESRESSPNRFMSEKEIHGYANICVEKLGQVVGEMREKGHGLGFSEDETKRVWLTVFSIFHENKLKKEREVMSKNLATLMR